MEKTLTVREAQNALSLINFVYSRDAQGKYLELTEKVNANLSKKMLALKKALKPIDQKIEDLRETHLQKDEQGNYKVEDGKPVFKTKTSEKVLNDELSAIEKEELTIKMGDPVKWEEMVKSNINGAVLTDMVIAEIVTEPND